MKNLESDLEINQSAYSKFSKGILNAKKEIGGLEKNNRKSAEKLPAVYDKLILIEKRLHKNKKQYNRFGKYLNQIQNVNFKIEYHLDDIFKFINIETQKDNEEEMN